MRLFWRKHSVSGSGLENVKARPAVYGIAASLFVLIGVGSIWLPQHLPNSQTPKIALASSISSVKLEGEVLPSDTQLTAHDAAIMYAKYERMRNGTCQFPEAIQIPDKDKAVYLENVVGGKIPTNLKDLATANAYLEKVRCNYHTDADGEFKIKKEVMLFTLPPMYYTT